MTWWQLVPALLCAAGISFLPGYLVLRCWAVSGLTAVGLAAPVSIGLIAVMAVLAPYAGWGWNILVVVVPAVVLAAVGLLLRLTVPRALGVRPGPRTPWRSRLPSLAVYATAVLIPAGLLGLGLTEMFGTPETISQTYDGIFHLNALRYILDSGSGSSLTLGGMATYGADPSPYPAAWHDLVALVIQVSGVPIPAAVHAVNLVIGALVWPIACIFLTTRVTGTRPVPVLFAGVLSAAFGAFPYLMVHFGVLYPFMLSLALLPAVVGLTAMATGVGERDATPRWLAALLLVGLVAPGLALAHPSTLLAAMLFAVPIFLTAVVRYYRTQHDGRWLVLRKAGLGALLLGYLAILWFAWEQLRPSEAASQWQPNQSISQAIGQVISAGLIKQGPSWVVLALTLVAVGLVVHRQLSMWVLGIYLLAAALFVVVSAAPQDGLRDFLTRLWYNDSFRLAGQLPFIMVVVCTIAATWLFGRFRHTLGTRFPAKFGWLHPNKGASAPVVVLAVVAAVVLGIGGQYGAVGYAVASGKNSYQTDEDAYVLTNAERALLERLDQHVPEGQQVVGNRSTGMPLVYAISGRRTPVAHVGGSAPPDINYLLRNLDKIGTDPLVCAIAKRWNAYYVLRFTGRLIHERDGTFPGLETLPSNPAATKIDQEGPGAALYRLTGCQANGRE